MLYSEFEDELRREFPDLVDNNAPSFPTVPSASDASSSYKGTEGQFEGGEDGEKKNPPAATPRLNYSHLDGLRGFGALAVYIHHFYMAYYHL